jgi:hypothetical protein
MGSRKSLVIIIAVGLIWAGRPCRATGTPNLRISELVTQSEVVVVADVNAIKPNGFATLNLNGNILSAKHYSAQAALLYSLAGSCPEDFSVDLVLPDDPIGYRSVKPGTRMLFLKRSGDASRPTNPYYPDLPALRSEPGELHGKNATERVLAELGAVMASADVSAADKWEVMIRSYAIPDGDRSFVNDLLTGLQSTGDPELRGRIQAELIGRNDISEFPDVRDALFANTISTTQKAVILYEIGQRLTNEKAVPGLTQLLKSPDPEVRVASAQGLWHIASTSSIAPLTEALGDQDSEVRYYAIRGLADATGDLQWGPSPGEYQEHGVKYLQHWLEWTRKNSTRTKD